MKYENTKFQETLIKQVGSEMALLTMVEMHKQKDECLERDLDEYFLYQITNKKSMIGGVFYWDRTQQGQKFWDVLDDKVTEKLSA